MEWCIAHSPLIHKYVNEEGYGCLHLAARENRINIMQYLLATNKEHLIDIEKTPCGNSPLHFFVRNPPPLGEENSYLSVFDDLINYMKNHNISDNPLEMLNKDGETPLHHACLKGNEFTIRLLIERGVNVNVQSSIGETSLHYAIRYCPVGTLINIFNSLPQEIKKKIDRIKGSRRNYNRFSNKI